MKRIIYLLCGISIFFGCSLKEEVVSNSTRDTYYKNEIQVRTGLNGCYTQIRTIYNNTGFWHMTECTTDLISLSNSTQYNANCDVSPSRPGVASKVLRAFYYYILTSTFGDVPFYTEAVTETNRARIARLPRMSAKETRDHLIDELMDYLLPESLGGKQALPLVRTYEIPDTKVYIGASVGLMLAGKMCLWNERYDDAITVFGQLEQIYGNCRGDSNKGKFAKENPLSDVKWSQKYVKESILELGNVVEEYGLIIKGGIASWCMPLRTSATSDEEAGSNDQSAIYNGIIIPELGGYAKIYTSALPTSYYYNRLLKYNSEDLRNGDYSNERTQPVGSSGNLAWRYPGTGYVTGGVVTQKEGIYWFNKPSSNRPNESVSKPYGNNQPYLGDKFWCFGMYNSQDSNNYKIFRYAGVLLNMAEAYLMGKNDMEMACEYLNVVRGRAGLSPLTPASVNNSQEALLEEIRMECARELIGEFQRKFDLVRWGIWYERASMYNEGLYIKGYMLPCHEYWPIPAEQVTYSGNALDNNAYKE